MRIYSHFLDLSFNSPTGLKASGIPYSATESVATRLGRAALVDAPQTFTEDQTIAQAKKLLFGADVNLYWGAANQLKTDDALAVGGALTVTGAATLSSTLGVTGNFAVNTNKFTVAAATGNTVVAGTLAVTGATTLSSTLGVTGDLSVATNKFTVAAATGNTVVAGTLAVTGATTLSSTLSVTGAVTLSSTLGVTGDFSVATNKFTVAAATGNTAMAGTLAVTGAATLSSTLVVTGNFAINTNKFTVAAATGNTGIAGTLAVTGAVTLSSTLGVTSDFSVNTSKFTVTAATGNTAVAGTLAVTGATTLSSTLGVTGDFSIATNKFTVAAATGNTAVAGTLAVTGTSSLATVNAGAVTTTGDFSAAGAKLTVSSTTGNAAIAGALTAAGAVLTTGNHGQTRIRHGGGYGGLTIEGSGPNSAAALTFGNNYGDTFAERWRVFLDGTTNSLGFHYGSTQGAAPNAAAFTLGANNSATFSGLVTASSGLTVTGTVTLPNGSVADTALSNNVALKSAVNSFAAGQSISNASAGAIALYTSVPGDAQARWALQVSGAQTWGDGTNARDTNLYRPSAGNLRTDHNFTLAGGDLTLAHAASNRINFGTVGVAAPTVTTRSLGVKIILHNSLSAGNADYAIGVESQSIWFGLPGASNNNFKWYNGATELMRYHTGTGSGLMIGAAANAAAKLEVQDSTNNSQIAFGATAGQGFLRGSNSATHLYWGATFNGNAYVAKQTAASIYSGAGSYHAWYVNTGLTAEATFTPTAVAWLNAAGLGIGNSDPKAKLDVTGMVRATAQTVPASGAGVEMEYALGSNTGYIRAYDRTGSVYKALNVEASTINLRPDGSTKLAVGSVWTDNAQAFRVSGTSTPTSGTGLELSHDGSAAGFIRSYDRTASAYKGIYVDGSFVSLRTSGVDRVVINSSLTDVSHGFRVTGTGTPGAGAGAELMYTGGVGVLQAYDRTGAAWRNLDVKGLVVNLAAAGTTRMTVGATSIDSTVPVTAPSVEIKSTTTANKFSIEYNETDDTLDFIFS
jgi:hypothetical protein